MVFFRQLCALLWKNLLIRAYNPITTVFEVLIPVLFSIFLAYMTKTIDFLPKDLSDNRNSTEYYRPEMGIDWVYVEKSFSKRKLYYSPSNAFTDDLMKIIQNMTSINALQMHSFNEMKQMIATNNFKMDFGVVFEDNVSNESTHFHYKLVTEMNGKEILDKTHETGRTDTRNSGAYKYLNYFCSDQTLINEALLRKISKEHNIMNAKTEGVIAFRFPFPGHHRQYSMGWISGFAVSFTIVIGYIVLCPLIVKRIVDEKSNKAKELMRMMGMSDWVFWSSHFVNYFIVMSFHALVFSVLFTFGIWSGQALLHGMNWFSFLIILMVYIIQTILFCMAFSTVFNSSIYGVLVMTITYLTLYSLHIIYAFPISGVKPKKNHFLRLMFSIIPTNGLTWTLTLAGELDSEGFDVGVKEFFKKTSYFGDITIAEVLVVQSLSCLLYAFLIWYLDSVWPFQYGVPKPFYFPFLPSYWCPKRSVIDVDMKSNATESQDFERHPNSKTSICVQNVSKEFGGEKGVHKLSLDIFNNELTCLLGHNGAGKTTLMNMITGIFPPDSGTISIKGYDIVSATQSARKSLGLCPQENVLFNDLTVRDHLTLYAHLKNFPNNQITKEVFNVLHLIRMTDKTNVKSKALSGGMKRKLCLGIALIGGSDVLILDEPTSGLDPEARRAIWDVLQGVRRQKTILLTTHYMDEADVLGDRIAIMSEGVLKCSGSPMFLKNRFSAGYQLRISKSKNFNNKLLEEILQRYLPQTRLQSEINTEVIYSLRSEDKTKSIDRNVFPVLFEEFDAKKAKLGINSYGISVTTMEDVFLKVGSQSELNSEKTDIKTKNRNYVKLKGFQLFCQRFVGLLLKRFHFGRRYWPMICLQIIIPALIFIVAFSSMKGIDEKNELKLDLQELYGKTKGFSNSFNFDTFGPEVYGPTAQRHDMETTDLKNQSTAQLNKWLINKSREVGFETYTEKFVVGGTAINGSVDGLNLEIWFNYESTHSLPLSINLMYEALIGHFIPSLKHKIKLTTTNVMASKSKSEDIGTAITKNIPIVCFLLLPLSTPFLCASYVLFPTQERALKSKLIQLMTGLSSFTFWLSHYVYDLFTHLLAIIVLFIVIYFFDSNQFFIYDMNTSIGLFLLLMSFGLSSIAIAYTISLLFHNSINAFVITYVFNLGFGFTLGVIYGLSHFIRYYKRFSTYYLDDKGFWISLCRLFPIFDINFGLTKLFLMNSSKQFCDHLNNNFNMSEKCEQISKLFNNSYVNIFEVYDNKWKCCDRLCQLREDGIYCFNSWNALTFERTGVLIEISFMLFIAFLFFCFVFTFEDFFSKILFSVSYEPNLNVFSDNSEDKDVLEERQRVNSLLKDKKLSEDAIVVINLTKEFNGLSAVNDLSFGVHKNECFGLLGVNGAGKTTTFSMLCGDIAPNDGNAFIDSHDLRFSANEFTRRIGYCPQFDALLERMTGEEMLYLFARLRGIGNKDIKREVESVVQMIDIQNYCKNQTKTYSGGNKRKLSLGLAIIGSPSLVFLDEPSAGVDPAARRKIWRSLNELKNSQNSSIILSSHSMDESEALCGRIAIMVKGRLRCLGSTQHLRSKFGQGFTLMVKMKRQFVVDENYVNRVKNRIQALLPSAALKDRHECQLHYHITDPSVKWSLMFRVMQTIEQELDLEDYTLSDTTLEQIFVFFAKQT